MFFVMLILFFLVSVNYNLSLGFALTFLIAACAVIDIHLTFRNLAHLYLLAGRTPPVFAGEEALFELHLINRRKHDRYAIWLGFINTNRNAPEQAIDLAANASCRVMLSAPTQERGWMPAPKVRLQTRFPLGLLRAWSYWQPYATVLVYPCPELFGPPLPLSGEAKNDNPGHSGCDNFSGIRGYQPGDSMRHLAWRQIAKLDLALGGQLVTKQFDGGTGGEIFLDFSTLSPTIGLEMRLSRMARWVIQAERRGEPYAFRLGDDIFLPPAFGNAHQNACLQALALYQGR